MREGGKFVEKSLADDFLTPLAAVAPSPFISNNNNSPPTPTPAKVDLAKRLLRAHLG